MTDIVRNLAEQICKEYGLGKENAQTKAMELYKKCPYQLRENLAQWAAGVELEDIYIGKYSVPLIMAIWGNRDFIGAVEVISEYFDGNQDIAERRIWQMRR